MSDRIMSLELEIAETMLNVVSLNAPKGGCQL